MVRRDERVRGHHGVGVVDGAVLAREGDEARALAQAVLELGPDLPPPVLEPLGGIVDHPLDLGDLLRLLGREREAEVERELRRIGRDVGELPAHPLLVGDEPIDRRAREADQRDVAVVQMHARGVELIPQVRASGAGAELVVGPEHDVVGEKLRAPVEELGERLLAVARCRTRTPSPPEPREADGAARSPSGRARRARPRASRARREPPAIPHGFRPGGRAWCRLLCAGWRLSTLRHVRTSARRRTHRRIHAGETASPRTKAAACGNRSVPARTLLSG